MKIIPAIDLLGGEAVRLHQGSYNEVTRYSVKPVELVRQFQEEGARRLHVVDLDAARAKSGGGGASANNRRLIREICRESFMEIEVGGGIRHEDDVKELIDLGVNRLVIGTLLVKDPDMAATWAARYPAEFVAGIDAKDGEVKIAGWEDGSMVRDEDLAARVAELGMRGIIYTNIRRDGTLSGPDIEGSIRIAEAAGLPVVVSGGMSSLEDCRQVAIAASAQGLESGYSPIEGVIIGKAFYEGRIQLGQAIMLYQGDEQ